MPISDKQSSPLVSDAALRLPGEPPTLPSDVLTRFPSLGTWMAEQRRFWTATQNGIQEVVRAQMDVLEVGGVLNVDPNNGSLFIRRIKGDGFYRDADTPFFVNTAGQFSLGAKLYWDPEASSLTIDGTIYADAGVIGGWTISATTLSASNIVLSSTGVITVGTGNDVAVMSAADATYRFWAGNATAASAPFSVTKAGAVMASSGTIGGFSLGADYLRDTANTFGLASTVTGGTDIRLWAGDTFANRATAPFRVYEDGSIFSIAGTIGGFTIGASSLTAVSGTDSIDLNSGGGGYLRFESTGSSLSLFAIEGMTAMNAAGDFALEVRSDAGSATYGVVSIYNGTGTETINLRGDTGAVTAVSFAGSGASLTALNASNIASGTINNSFLPAAISVTSLTASGEIRGATARFGTFTGSADAPVTGSVAITDAGGATRKLATIA